MRQGQQSRRGRNRSNNGGGGNNNNRKSQNSLSRNYESNGPDVKIRGTAMHIAEKYSSLARDAMASGDIVMAENYLQHSEHYNRIVMAVQTQNSAGPGEHANGFNGSNNRFAPSENFPREFDGEGYEEGEHEEFAHQNQAQGRFQEPRNYNQHQQPQPYISQPGYAHAPLPPQAQAINGNNEQPVVGDAAFGEEGDRAPRRRRRRPMNDDRGGYNGRSNNRNGSAPHQPVVFGAPDTQMSSGDETLV